MDNNNTEVSSISLTPRRSSRANTSLVKASPGAILTPTTKRKSLLDSSTIGDRIKVRNRDKKKVFDAFDGASSASNSKRKSVPIGANNSAAMANKKRNSTPASRKSDRKANTVTPGSKATQAKSGQTGQRQATPKSSTVSITSSPPQKSIRKSSRVSATESNSKSSSTPNKNTQVSAAKKQSTKKDKTSSAQKSEATPKSATSPNFQQQSSIQSKVSTKDVSTKAALPSNTQTSSSNAKTLTNGSPMKRNQLNSPLTNTQSANPSLTTTIEPSRDESVAKAPTQPGTSTSAVKRIALNFKDLTDSSEFEEMINDKMSVSSSNSSIMGVPKRKQAPIFNTVSKAPSSTAPNANSTVASNEKEGTIVPENQIAIFQNPKPRSVLDQYMERQIFTDVSYQKECLKKYFNLILQDHSGDSRLAIVDSLEQLYSPLPNPDVFDAIIRFDHNGEPVFDFFLPSEGTLQPEELLKHIDREMYEISKAIYEMICQVIHR